MSSANIKLIFIDTKDPLYEKECELRVEVLRRPLGMGAGTEKFPFEEESLHLVAVLGDDVVGCVLFHPEENAAGRLFQMAIAAHEQKRGVGTMLVEKMEEKLGTLGYKEIRLHARDVAAEFYKRLNYEIYGDRHQTLSHEKTAHMKAKDLGIISLEHKGLISQALERFPPTISEHTFTNLFIWRSLRPLHVIWLADSICFAEAKNDGLLAFGPPVGPCDIALATRAIQQLFDKPVAALLRIPSEMAVGISKEWTATEDRDNFDYVYTRNDLVELSGNALHAKKNLVAQCLQSYDCRYEPVTPANVAELVHFQKRWCEKRKCGETHSLCHEYRATLEAIKNFDSLNLTGGIIRIGGQVEAYSVGERLNENTAVVHFEKASAEFKGLYQLMNKWFAEKALDRFQFINREQDLGVDGLRKAKLSYKPNNMVKKVIILKKGTSLPLTLSERHCSEPDEPHGRTLK